MPIYEYQCQQCGHRIEALQRFADPPLEVCEACGGPLKRLISSPAFHFKGSGWYVTDYARKGSAAEGKKEEKGGEAAGEAKGEAKGEGKSEAKGESKGEDKGESKGERKEGSASPSGSSSGGSGSAAKES